MNVKIIDYGMGNLISVLRALEECGAQASIAEVPSELKDATHIILPGVGSFTDGMEQLRTGGWTSAIRDIVAADKSAFLGICLGMQLMADFGEEGGGSEGLGLIPGRVTKLQPTQAKELIPHVGWNEIWPKSEHSLFDEIPSGSDFYFVHSFHFQTEEESAVLATTPYCNHFVSVIGRGRVLGVQFHPEKSQKRGFLLLRNFLAL